MIPKNAIRRKPNSRRFSRRYKLVQNAKSVFFPLEKDGVMTCYGVKNYQDWFMQEEKNYVFGTAYDMEVGLATNGIFSNRNYNQLVIGASAAGKSYNYLLSNLRQKNHSSVITDYGFSLREEENRLKNEGVKTHRVDFCYPDASSRYNPFLHVTTESQITLLSELICDFIGLGKRTGDPFHEKLEVRLMDLAVNYIVKSDTLEKKDKTFFALSKIIQKICKEGLGVTREYDIDDKYRDFLVYPSEKFAKKTEPLANAVSILSFPEFNCFTELSETDNISAEELGTGLTYVFVSGRPFNKGGYSLSNLAGFFISSLAHDLYRFAESCAWGKTRFKSLNPSHLLPRHVHFYLDEFQNCSIPNFLYLLSANRKYGVGFSVMIQSIEEIREKYLYDEWHIIPDNCDTMIFLGNSSIEDYEFFSKATSVNMKTTDAVAGSYYKEERKLLPNQIEKITKQKKMLVLVRDCTPFVCEKPNPENYR